MSEKNTCELCGRVGTNGARWLVATKDGKTVKVHKPCGEQLAALAPPAVEARLIPSAELKADWARERSERQARNFWADRCPQLPQLKQQLEKEEAKP